MNEFKGQVKRALSERKFNAKDNHCCCTGGRGNSCPFFRLSKKAEWICTLYRLMPKFTNGRYGRLGACLSDLAPTSRDGEYEKII